MKRFAKKALAGTLSLAMVLGMTAVVNPETVDAKKVKVKKVTVTAPSGKTAYVAKGKKISLTATVKVTPNKKANKKVTYKSASSKVATVNAKGQVKGVKVGSTKITVTSKKDTKKKATIKVVVKKAAVKKVKLNAKTATVAIGGKKTLKATVTPKKNTCTKVVWTSSKKKVATVSAKGVVKGKKEGTATITAKAADGSGKKATCKVTVGAGIKSIAVPHRRIVRVTLTSAKTLTAADFTVQNKKIQSRNYTTSEEIEQVRTTDGGKTYDIVLDSASGIMEDSYVKVTLSKNSSEVFITNIAGYGYGVTDTIQRVTYTKGKEYSANWELDNYDAVGTVKYSVEGLPSGLKAYINKNQTVVTVRGKFDNVENGTTAVLTGVDEEGKTFKKSYVFYVGSKDQIVGNVLSKTVLSYTPDNPNTKAYEDSGFDFTSYGNRDVIVEDWLAISGGTGSYTYSVSGLPAAIDTMSTEGNVHWVNDEQAIPAGTYNVTLNVKDSADHSASFPFTLTIVDGVVITGTVKDASGEAAKDMDVAGYTRMDAYGDYESFADYTEKKADGSISYGVRVIPGDYYTYASYSSSYYYGETYDVSVDNNFTAPGVKDYSIPLYKVNFTTTIPGAAVYRLASTPYLVDAYGKLTALKRDYDDFTLYAYLKAGTYETQTQIGDEDHNYNNTVVAYSKLSTTPYKDGVLVSTSYEDRIGERAWQVSAPAFTVSAAATVQLNAAMLPENGYTSGDYWYDDDYWD